MYIYIYIIHIEYISIYTKDVKALKLDADCYPSDTCFPCFIVKEQSERSARGADSPPMTTVRVDASP